MQHAPTGMDARWECNHREQSRGNTQEHTATATLFQTTIAPSCLLSTMDDTQSPPVDQVALGHAQSPPVQPLHSNVLHVVSSEMFWILDCITVADVFSEVCISRRSLAKKKNQQHMGILERRLALWLFVRRFGNPMFLRCMSVLVSFQCLFSIVCSLAALRECVVLTRLRLILIWTLRFSHSSIRTLVRHALKREQFCSDALLFARSCCVDEEFSRWRCIS